MKRAIGFGDVVVSAGSDRLTAVVDMITLVDIDCNGLLVREDGWRIVGALDSPATPGPARQVPLGTRLGSPRMYRDASLLSRTVATPPSRVTISTPSRAYTTDKYRRPFSSSYVLSCHLYSDGTSNLLLRISNPVRTRARRSPFTPHRHYSRYIVCSVCTRR